MHKKRNYNINHEYFSGPTVTFTDEIEAAQIEVDKLKADGAKVIIGLSHTGYIADQRVASMVDGIDVIVGGHSHSLLYTGNTVNPLYTDTRYNDKIRYNDNLNVTKPSRKR